MNKVIIAGSRTIDNYNMVELYINSIITEHDDLEIDEIVCGEARGIDTCGKEYANKYNIPVKSFPAQWNKFGKSAGYKRNEEMAKYATHLILIWDGLSKGSGHMLGLAKKYNLRIYQVIIES